MPVILSTRTRHSNPSRPDERDSVDTMHVLTGRLEKSSQINLAPLRCRFSFDLDALAPPSHNVGCRILASSNWVASGAEVNM